MLSGLLVSPCCSQSLMHINGHKNDFIWILTIDNPIYSDLPIHVKSFNMKEYQTASSFKRMHLNAGKQTFHYISSIYKFLNDLSTKFPYFSFRNKILASHPAVLIKEYNYSYFPWGEKRQQNTIFHCLATMIKYARWPWQKFVSTIDYAKGAKTFFPQVQNNKIMFVSDSGRWCQP